MSNRFELDSPNPASRPKREALGGSRRNLAGKLGRTLLETEEAGQRPRLADQPGQPDKLMRPEQPPGRAQYFQHQFDGYGLEARVTYNRAGDWPAVLSLHGARGDYTRANPVTFGLQEKGVSILAPNLSGHSPGSPLSLEQTSLDQNIREAHAFYGYLDQSRPKAIIGYSMAGTATLELLKSHPGEIDRLVLFYPAIYSKASYSQPFGPEFRAAIQPPYSYLDNDLLDSLADFDGRILIIKGEYDGLEGPVPGRSAGEVEIGGQTYYSPIPKEVFDLLLSPDKFPRAQRRLIEVPGCDHSVTNRMAVQPELARQLVGEIKAFLEA